MMRNQPASGAAQRLIAIALLLAVLSVVWLQSSLLARRTFDPDEFQHAHSAYAISRGQLPYVDYFDHHPPLFHALLAPVVRELQADRDADHALRALFALRVLNWIVALVGFFLHHLLARRYLGAIGASVASLLLVSSVVVFEKTMEIRPDTMAFALLQASLLLLARNRRVPAIAVGSSLLGLGLMFTPKVAFPILGIGLAVWLDRSRGTVSNRRLISALALGLAWPAALCALYFLARGALPDFVEHNLLINLRWKARLAPWPFLMSRFVEPNPLFAGLSVLGLSMSAIAWAKREGPDRDGGERMLFLSGLSGVVGLVALPVAWEQYYLFLLPQLAILASGALVRLAALSGGRSASPAGPAVAVLLVTAIGLWPSREPILRQRLRTDDRKERAIRLIMDNSTVDEGVLDGFTGIGVFRPHAFRYFFLHAEVRQMLGRTAIAELETGLRSGVIARHFASADSHLAAVSPDVAAQIARDFEIVDEGPVTVRLFPGRPEDWEDTRVRSLGQPVPPEGPYVLCLEGWSGRESTGGAAFRRSRGKWSALVFPVRDPERLRSIELRAKAGAEVAGLSTRVSVNGADLGEIVLGPAFTVSELALEPGMLRRGLNRLELAYPLRPAQIDPVAAARGNEAIALESVALRARQVQP